MRRKKTNNKYVLACACNNTEKPLSIFDDKARAKTVLANLHYGGCGAIRCKRNHVVVLVSDSVAAKYPGLKYKDAMQAAKWLLSGECKCQKWFFRENKALEHFFNMT